MTSELVPRPWPEDLTAATSLVVYAIDDQRYALPLSVVERVVPVVAITPLPEAPEAVAGVINWQGRIIPVLDCRKHFHLSLREVELSDQLLIARTSLRTVALLVDRVEGVMEAADGEIVAANEILPGMEAQAALKLPDGRIVLVQDFEQALSLEDREQLEPAMRRS